MSKYTIIQHVHHSFLSLLFLCILWILVSIPYITDNKTNVDAITLETNMQMHVYVCVLALEGSMTAVLHMKRYRKREKRVRLKPTQCPVGVCWLMWLLLRLWGLSLLHLSITDFLLEIARTLPFNSAENMDGLADIKKHWNEDCASHVLTLFMQGTFAEGPLRTHEMVWLAISYLVRDNETICSFFLWVNKPPPFRQCAVHHDLKISWWTNKHHTSALKVLSKILLHLHFFTLLVHKKLHVSHA